MPIQFASVNKIIKIDTANRKPCSEPASTKNYVAQVCALTLNKKKTHVPSEADAGN